jgi:hypothetical protein
MRGLITGIVGLAAIAGGCAGTDGSTAQMARASLAIRAAEEAGSRAIPWARLYLDKAVAHYRGAVRLVEKGERDRAFGLLLRAEADADLARAKAAELEMSAGAERAVDRLRIPAPRKESHVVSHHADEE